MQKQVWLRRVILNGWHNFARNKILAVASILIIALMFYVFNVILALSLATDSVIESVGRRIDIAAEIKPEVENYTIQTVVGELRDLPEVEDVLFISKEDALRKFGAKYPNVISFLERNHLENPLPSTLRIVSRAVENNSAIIAFLEKPQYESIINQEKLKTDQDQKGRNEKILGITRFLNSIGLWLNIVFALVAVMIIFNSINLTIHAHQDEINIMQLVGAKYSFIRAGYLMEGVFYSLFAFIFSLIFAKVTLVYITQNLIKVITNESLLVGLNAILVHFQDRFWVTFVWQILGVLFVGFISSYLAIELYLKKRQNF